MGGGGVLVGQAGPPDWDRHVAGQREVERRAAMQREGLQSSLGGGVSQAKPNPVMATALKRLAVLGEQAEALARRAGVVADRAVGSVPQAGTSDGAVAGPAERTVAQELHAALARLDNALTAASAAVDRIEGFV